MGKLTNLINAKVSGNVGAMSFRRRGAETVVAERSYTNSSKGKGATEAQRLHRCRLANIVNFFRTIAAIEARAWEKKPAYVSDFNMLAKINLASSNVFLTREEASLNASVVAPYIVSRGSLPVLNQSMNEGQFASGVFLPAALDLTTATIAEVSAAIIENNVNFRADDKLSVCLIMDSTQTISGVRVPVAQVTYFEITVDLNNSVLFSEIPNFSVVEPIIGSAGMLCFNGGFDAGFAIHSRQSAGLLETSEQMVIMNNLYASNYHKYSSEAQKILAMNSYGYQGEVLLTPYSEGIEQEAVYASLTDVKLGSEAITNGGTTSTRDTITIAGTDIKGNNLYLTCDGVKWSPMTSSSTQLTYSLDKAGHFAVVVNGVVEFEWDATVPAPVQTFSSIKFGNQTFNAPKSGIAWGDGVSADSVQPMEVEIVGTEMGDVSGPNVVIANFTANTATLKKFTLRPTSANPSGQWLVSVGGVVVLAGSYETGGFAV